MNEREGGSSPWLRGTVVEVDVDIDARRDLMEEDADGARVERPRLLRVDTHGPPVGENIGTVLNRDGDVPVFLHLKRRPLRGELVGGFVDERGEIRLADRRIDSGFAGEKSGEDSRAVAGV